MAAGTLKAKQITASGLIVGRRALFKQLLVFHPIVSDSEQHYHFDVYGKGNSNFPIVEPGVLFDDGIYVVIPAAGITVTVLYEEV